MDGRDGEVATIGARPQPAPETTATAHMKEQAPLSRGRER